MEKRFSQSPYSTKNTSDLQKEKTSDLYRYLGSKYYDWNYQIILNE